MKQRKVTIFSGKTFTVPQGIQRIDSHSTHGWQVRYQGTKFFSDGIFSGTASDGSGAAASLAAATTELLRRIATMPAPVALKRGPSAHKKSELPPGISGPIVVARGAMKVRSAVLSVLIPRWGRTPQLRSVYIGTENTYTKTKYRAALAEAKALRAEAVAAYEADATQARRREAVVLRKSLSKIAAPSEKAKSRATGSLPPLAKRAAPRRVTGSTTVRTRPTPRAG